MKQIPLSQGLFALVDDADFDALAQFRWHAAKMRNKFYAGRMQKLENGKWRSRTMARDILGIEDPKVFVDHIDGDSLNNQRSNLRACSNSENRKNACAPKNNSSGFKGVHKNCNRWVAAVRSDKKVYYLGVFDSAEEAARHYNKKAIEVHGVFAKLNSVEPMFPTKDRCLLRLTNKSGVNGVCFCNRTKKWLVTKTVNGQKKHIGYFTDKEEAALAYIQFAKTNS